MNHVAKLAIFLFTLASQAQPVDDTSYWLRSQEDQNGKQIIFLHFAPAMKLPVETEKDELSWQIKSATGAEDMQFVREPQADTYNELIISAPKGSKNLAEKTLAQLARFYKLKFKRANPPQRK